MTEKPAENGPVDPTRQETPAHTEAQAAHTEAQPPRDETVPLLDDTKLLRQESDPGLADPDEPRPETSPPGGFPPPPPPPGGFPPPPPGGFPPPSGSFFPPPQSTGGAFATRYGLIRPHQGRWFAGVAAAIGRATNTDPVLWRVLLGVLTLFGGVGLLVYLVGWLLIPTEGDTASPAEALIGRGRSSTSAPLAVGLAVLAVIMLGVAFSGNIRSSLLGAAVILGAALLVSRGGVTLGRPANQPPQPPQPGWPGRPEWPAQPGSPVPPMGNPVPPMGNPVPPMGGPVPMGGPIPPAAPTTGAPFTPTGEPFAPHGPYASSSPYARSLGYPPPPPAQYPGLVPTPPPPPKPPRERSRLGRIVLSLVCLALGALLVFDATGNSVPRSAYPAAALGVIGLGLVVGAWLGRARWLIFPGVILTVALVIASSMGNVRGFPARPWHAIGAGPNGNMTWTPPSAAALESRYNLDLGNGTLDLTKIEFPADPVTVDVNIDAGNLVVILPADVDVNVDATVDSGSADVLSQHWDGLGNDTRHVSDNGADGPGGGQLMLNATVGLGKLEVHR
jgi:phage shock protein PspC (stress-responsive transcriptional regulator)